MICRQRRDHFALSMFDALEQQETHVGSCVKRKHEYYRAECVRTLEAICDVHLWLFFP